jgi:hypothetical protein
VVGGTGRPMVATETGYKYPPGVLPTVTQAVGGIYVPGMYLHYFDVNLPSGAKIVRTPVYELLQGEAHYKLVNTDGGVTPAYTALRNLITLLADPGPPFTPGSLDYQLSGWTEGVRHILLQKRDRVFYLAIWLAKQIWDPKTQKPMTVSSQAVRLTFGEGINRVDQVFPNDGTAWKLAKILDGEVALSVGPRVLLLRITPR